MKQLIKNDEDGKLVLLDTPIPALNDNFILVKNHYSVISLGTEFANIAISKKNIIQKAIERPEDFKKVIKLGNKIGYLEAYKVAIEKMRSPGTMGYSSCGEIIDKGKNISEFQIGDMVACAGAGYASHSEIIRVPTNVCIKIPPNVNSRLASFTTLGSIAMQSVRQANVQIGDKILVVGLGLIGQLVISILSNAGCEVIGVDIDSSKVAITKKINSVTAFVRTEKNLSQKIISQTDGFGIDKSIITAATDSNDPVDFSVELLRDRGEIVVLGNVSMNFSWKKAYMKDISIKMSRSYGPGRYDYNYEEKGIDYPIGYVRWTEKRNMASFLKLLSDKKIPLEKLITHEFAFDKSANKTYEKLSNCNDLILGSVFKYDTKKLHQKKIYLNNKAKKNKKSQCNIGFIGAGSYAQSFLLPRLSKIREIRFKGVCTGRGENAKYISEKYDFNYCTTLPSEIINDPEIDTVFILTRHNSHAELATECLSAGKNVFVEKPLSIRKENLDALSELFLENKLMPHLMVGYNRRYSKHTALLRKELKGRSEPIVINYRISAEKLAKEHWFFDKEIGGGRILSESCHFIDYCTYIVGHEVTSFDIKTTHSSTDIPNDNDFILNLSFSDGSIANITYHSIGGGSLPKERIEVSGSGKTLVINDFQLTSIYSGNNIKKLKTKTQDKGRTEMLHKFINSLKNGKRLISVNELISTTDLTIKIQES